MGQQKTAKFRLHGDDRFVTGRERKEKRQGNPKNNWDEDDDDVVNSTEQDDESSIHG